MRICIMFDAFEALTKSLSFDNAHSHICEKHTKHIKNTATQADSFSLLFSLMNETD